MRALGFAAVVLLALCGCETDTAGQHRLALTLPAESLAQRQMQGRRFDSNDETAILSATAGVLQDLGFVIEESSAQVGLVVGSKDRDAVEAGQVAGQLFLAALVTAFGGKADPVWETNQKIRISTITTPSADRAAIFVRANIQRVVWNSKNQVSRVETILDPIIYQQFFDKLSQSIFLEAHQI